MPFADLACDPFWQEGTPDAPEVYWLAIRVTTTDSATGEPTQMGWKTARTHWNDDGVMMSPLLAPEMRMELVYPPNHPNGNGGLPDIGPDSIDLSFEIKTSEDEIVLDACCYENSVGVETCADMLIGDCLDLGGTPHPGESCIDPSFSCPLPDPLAACCLPDGTCADLTVGDCMAQFGTPQGVGTDCATPTGIECPTIVIPPFPIPCIIEPVSCENGLPAVHFSLDGGIADNFGNVWLDPPPTPNTPLLNYITTYSASGIPLGYDDVPGVGGVLPNSWFGHTFSSLPNNVVGAYLEIKVRGTTGIGSLGTNNDHIGIVNSGDGDLFSCRYFSWL